jgi:toxin ParE1/3/4
VNVVFTHEAEIEIEAIGDHIAKESPGQAIAFVLGLRRHCEKLADMPKRYPLTPRYETSGVRRTVHGNFLVFYRVTSASVEILHIVHGARDYEPLLFPTE